MFILRILIAYILPALYLYFRIKGLIYKRSHKILFTLLYLLLIAAFPLTEILSHSSHAFWLRPVLIFGYFSLPYILYLFLVSVLFDFLLGLNRLIKIVPIGLLQTRKIRIIYLLLLLLLPVIIVLHGWVKNNYLQVNEYQIKVSAKSSSLHHLRIVLASDFHLGELTNDSLMERFSSKINSLHADILLIPGDVLEGDRQDIRLEEFERQFRRIQTKYGVYASPGNHEYHGMRDKVNFFEKSNIKFLADSAVAIDNAFVLVGRNDGHSRQRKSTMQLMQSIPDSLPVFVLSHRPVDLVQIGSAGADIVVSGHTHEGQMFPFNYIVQRMYEVSWGYKKIGNLHVFVTSGLQVWGPPVRTAGDAEIMLIEADFK